VCRARDPEGKGTFEVIIPRSNARDLMLDEEVVEACAAGRFKVTTVETLEEAMEILTGEVWTQPRKRGLHDRAVAALEHLAAVQALTNAPVPSKRAGARPAPKAARSRKR
jgi:predicted ATP-dependent protease